LLWINRFGESSVQSDLVVRVRNRIIVESVIAFLANYSSNSLTIKIREMMEKELSNVSFGQIKGDQMTKG
jgi:hypothetical protein